MFPALSHSTSLRLRMVGVLSLGMAVAVVVARRVVRTRLLRCILGDLKVLLANARGIKSFALDLRKLLLDMIEKL